MKYMVLYFLLGLSLAYSSFLADNKLLLGAKYEGNASYYGPKFHGKTTANGEKMNQTAMTCAHKTLPFGTMLEVRNKVNDSTVIVRVNDRGPFVKGRIVDVSSAAAEKLKMREDGVISVVMTIVGEKGKVYIQPSKSIFFTEQMEIQNTLNY